MTATPLSTTTSRRDIIKNSTTKIPSSPQINYSDETLANLNITAGTLKDLEADIADDAANLLTLQQAINKSEQLAFRLTRILHDYEARIGEVERIVMPVYRNILNMSQMNDRIEGTISLVEYLTKINEQVRKEVIILLPGPEIESLLVYLDSISRLEAILQDLTHSDLSHCKISIERATAAATDARQKLQAAFRSWLSSDTASSAVTASELSMALQTVINFSLNFPTHFSALISDWIEIRSNYLATSCEPLFVQAQSFAKDPCGYQPGSHPLPEAFAHSRTLLQSEEAFMATVWPTTAVGPTFLRSAQIVRDLAVTTVESITSKMKKALTRREYADQVYLFNVLGACYTAVHSEGSQDSLAIQVLIPSLKYFITTTATLLTDLIGEIRGTIPRALERPFAVAQNATVYELTSITVNVLKRIEKDDLVIDSILAGQSTNNWDGTLAPIGSSDYSSIKRYFNDIIGSLESSIDAKSKTLRKPMQTLIFQLNNYNYLEKGLGQIKTELIDSNIMKRYEQIIETLKRSFLSR
jgi:exocyst complex component 7